MAKLEEVEAQERADDVGMPIASGGKAGKKGGSKKAVKVRVTRFSNFVTKSS